MGTEIRTRHDFNGLHHGRQGRDITRSNSSFFLHSSILIVIVGVLDVVIFDEINVIEKALQTHLPIYHPLHVKCLQYDNATSNIQYEWKVL